MASREVPALRVIFDRLEGRESQLDQVLNRLSIEELQALIRGGIERGRVAMAADPEPEPDPDPRPDPGASVEEYMAWKRRQPWYKGSDRLPPIRLRAVDEEVV